MPADWNEAFSVTGDLLVMITYVCTMYNTYMQPALRLEILKLHVPEETLSAVVMLSPSGDVWYPSPRSQDLEEYPLRFLRWNTVMFIQGIVQQPLFVTGTSQSKNDLPLVTKEVTI